MNIDNKRPTKATLGGTKTSLAEVEQILARIKGNKLIRTIQRAMGATIEMVMFYTEIILTTWEMKSMRAHRYTEMCDRLALITKSNF